MTEMNPTTPASSPLDTLKALVLRNIDALDHLGHELAGGDAEVPESVLEYLDALRQQQYSAIAEHLPVGRDEHLGDLRHLPPATRVYDDGSPVVEAFRSGMAIAMFYPRYDGDRKVFTDRHMAAASSLAAIMAADSAPAMISDLDEWRRAGNYVDAPLDDEAEKGAEALIQRSNALGPGATVGDLFKAQQEAAERENDGDDA
ncbi:hypothetical protein [Leucobacter chromiiresistens]|uniref:Uncharacterized protein n=1 Tax=Leucobacter chromiiresistens TaxID=1079994 RepID=A0A1H0Y8K6_9MICO|nr:hypothetical protein [Leucobacter chromiiresistens]SDQ11487.1 hypothetical protein SAMN04488565_0630 [Leucobacter chromiiresistens]